MTQTLILNLFESLKSLRELGITILLVEQNVQMALAISDYGYVLAEGKVELQGPARELIKNEHIRQAYLGLLDEPQQEKLTGYRLAALNQPAHDLDQQEDDHHRDAR